MNRSTQFIITLLLFMRLLMNCIDDENAENKHRSKTAIFSFFYLIVMEVVNHKNRKQSPRYTSLLQVDFITIVNLP